jgi:RND family efflux transporter MFP subunit
VDNAVDGLAAKRAAAESARANVRRLEQLSAFQKIDAPFDGVITARNTDIGQLIDSGSGGAPARELFRIAATDTMRVFVNVPQTHSRAAAPGLPVDVTFAERAGKRYRGKIARTASSIDPATGTLLVEVDLDNAAGEILPGSFGEVHLQLPSGAATLLLPVSALMFRSEGVRVATLGPGDRAALVPVTLGRDYGTKVEVTSGLQPGTRVIDSPPDSLVDGQQVRVGKAVPR